MRTGIRPVDCAPKARVWALWEPLTVPKRARGGRKTPMLSSRAPARARTTAAFQYPQPEITVHAPPQVTHAARCHFVWGDMRSRRPSRARAGPGSAVRKARISRPKTRPSRERARAHANGENGHLTRWASRPAHTSDPRSAQRPAYRTQRPRGAPPGQPKNNTARAVLKFVAPNSVLGVIVTSDQLRRAPRHKSGPMRTGIGLVDCAPKARVWALWEPLTVRKRARRAPNTPMLNSRAPARVRTTEPFQYPQPEITVHAPTYVTHEARCHFVWGDMRCRRPSRARAGPGSAV